MATVASSGHSVENCQRFVWHNYVYAFAHIIYRKARVYSRCV